MSVNSFADNAKANDQFSKGIDAFKAKKFREAATLFNAAEIYADDGFMKAKAIKAAARSYNYAKLHYQEFKEIEKLLGGFPSHVDFEKMVTREFEIGEKYFDGYREREYKYFTWIKGDDKTVEVYEKALARGPFAKMAPKAKLRLGRIYLVDGKKDKALKMFREVSTQYPGAPEQKYGYLELGNALIQMARKGDGDGANAKKAKQVLQTIVAKYPDDAEAAWAKDALVEADEIAAKRLHGVASFYKRTGKPEVAQQYFKEVVREFPDTRVAEKSEGKLVEIDSSYVPQQKDKKAPLTREEAEALTAELEEKVAALTHSKPLKDNPEVFDIVPENSNGRWLLPIKKLDPKSKILISPEELERERRAEEARVAAEKRKKAKEALRKIMAEEKALAAAKAALEEAVARNSEIHKRLKSEYVKRKGVESSVKTEVQAFSKVSDEITIETKKVDQTLAQADVDNTAVAGLNKTIKSLVADKNSAVSKAEIAVNAKKNIISEIKATDRKKVASQKKSKALAAQAPEFDPNEAVSLNDPDKVIARLKEMEDARKSILAQLTEQEKVTVLAEDEVVGEKKALAQVNEELKARKAAVKLAEDELKARRLMLEKAKLAADKAKAKAKADAAKAEQLKREQKAIEKKKADAEKAKKEAEALAAAKKAEAEKIAQDELKKAGEKIDAVAERQQSSFPWGIVIAVIGVCIVVGGFIKFRKKA